MRASFAVLALAAVVSAGSISKRQLPACALACITTADTGDCNATDNSCLCKSDAFVNSTYACIASTCSGNDLQTSIDGARALCAAAGVSLTQSVPSSTDAASTEAGSATESAPAETPAPSASATAPVPSGSASASRSSTSSRASNISTASHSSASPTASSAPNGAVSATSVSGMVGALAAVAGFMFAL